MRVTLLKSQLGFTLLELIVVIVIVGILSSLAIPRYNTVLERVRSAEGVNILDSLLKAQVSFNYEFGNYSNNINNLDITIPPARHFDTIAANNANPVASLSRTTGEYTLGINADGTIICTPIPAANPICTKIGL